MADGSGGATEVSGSGDGGSGGNGNASLPGAAISPKSRSHPALIVNTAQPPAGTIPCNEHASQQPTHNHSATSPSATTATEKDPLNQSSCSSYSDVPLDSSLTPTRNILGETLVFAATPSTFEPNGVTSNKDELIVHYGLHSVQGHRAEMEDDHKCVHRGVCDPVTPHSYLGSSTKKNGDEKSPPSPPQESRPSSADSNSESTGAAALPGDESDDDASDYTTSHPDISFFGVYDGHAGTAAATFLRQHLHRAVLRHPKLHEDPELALKEAIANIEARFVAYAEEQRLDAGSTLAVVLIIDNQLVVANVGDSEVALSRGGAPVVLSTIHNMRKNTAEEERVKGAGGRIHHKRLGHPRYNPSFFSIAVTRSIGDVFFKSSKFTEGKISGLIADADTQKVTLQNDDRFVIVGCDGLWDVMTYQQAIDFVEQRLTKGMIAQQICEELVSEALNRGSTDNITALVITLK